MDLTNCRAGSVRRPVAALLLFVAATVGGAPAPAQTLALGEAEVFTVRDVAVDVTAATAADARAKALRDGQAEAFDRMLRRLTRRSDHNALPRTDAEAAAFLIQGLEVANEKTSSVRYLADLTVRFKPDEVRRLLRQTGVPFAETASKPLLVLPVLKSRVGLLLWEAANLWRTAWTELKIQRGLVPMIVPLGDLADIADIDAAQAMLGEAAALAAIVQRYQAGSALVALATLSVRDDGLVVVDVVTSRPDTSTETSASLTFTAVSTDEVADLMATAAGETAAAVEDGWLERHLLRFDQSQGMKLAIPMRSLEEWISVQRKLRSITIVSRVDLRVLRRDAAEIEIEYFGDESQLTSALAERALELEEPLPQLTIPDPQAAGQPLTPSTDTSDNSAQLRVLRPRGP
jgi:hypothetical protein